MEQVSPTRSELLSIKSQIRLAEQGAKLLRGKREALVREFLKEIRSFRADRGELLRNIDSACKALMRALSLDTPEAVKAVGLAPREDAVVDLVERNIWGTRVADVESAYRLRNPDERGYSPLNVSARLDDTVAWFEKTVFSVIRVAPRFHKLGRLAEEIGKTSRRVNALEQRLLPDLAQRAAYIRGILDQREREDIFRLKRIKKKHSQKGRKPGVKQ
jgi:V/A-type H+/Na+-transporting ATPase subunit D